MPTMHCHTRSLATRTQLENLFKVGQASRLKRSYNIHIKDIANAGLTINLYRKGLFREELIGTVVVPVVRLQHNVVTMNTLQVDCKNKKDAIACRLITHLCVNGEAPYNAPTADPTLPQFDTTQFSLKEKSLPNKAITNSMDAPLLASRAF